MKVVATICSRKKDANPQLLPAGKRYLGDHVKKVSTLAINLGHPLYILSGKFGLISSDLEISDYDYYLEMTQVDLLGQKIKTQLIDADISSIDFHIEDKDSWAPYIKAMRNGADLAGIPLNICNL
jgi:hypothetical protein